VCLVATPKGEQPCPKNERDGKCQKKRINILNQRNAKSIEEFIRKELILSKRDKEWIL
jgi:hypothetical protein